MIADVEKERAVIGCILFDADKSCAVCDRLGISEESFTSPLYKRIYKVCHDIVAEGTLCDNVTINSRLMAQGYHRNQSESTDDILDGTPTASDCESYALSVREMHNRRVAHEAGAAMMRMAESGDFTAEQVTATAEESVLSLSKRMAVGEKTWASASMQFAEESIATIEGRGKPRISSGIEALDDAWMPMAGEIGIIAASTSMGKSALALNIAEHNSYTGKVGFFSAEMKDTSIAGRSILSRVGKTTKCVYKQLFCTQEKKELLESAQDVSTMNIVVDDRSGLDVSTLRSVARRWSRDGTLKLIVVDYLQLYNSREKAKQGRTNEVGYISGQLKAMALELDIPVLVLSQLSRKVDDRDGQVPRLSDLRESGSIEHDSDFIWLLRRPCRIKGDPDEEDAGLAIIDMPKCRNGCPKNDIRIGFNGPRVKFGEYIER